MKARIGIHCFYISLIAANAGLFLWLHDSTGAAFYLVCSSLLGFFWGVAYEKIAARQRELAEIEVRLDRSYDQERFRATGVTYFDNRSSGGGGGGRLAVRDEAAIAAALKKSIETQPSANLPSFLHYGR
jgi:hypothetical protein